VEKRFLYRIIINTTKIGNVIDKYNLTFNYENIDISNVNFMVLENDEDYNYDYKTNINMIESGDYGMPLRYTYKISVNRYDILDDDERKVLEDIIINDILKIIFKKI